MPFFYLTDTVGTGVMNNTTNDPFRPRFRDAGGAIKLRRRGQAMADVKWLVCLQASVTHAEARLIGVDKADDPGTTTRQACEDELGYGRGELTDTRLDELIYSMLIQPPATDGWNPLKSSRLQGALPRPWRGPREFVVHLGVGGRLISKPEIQGGVDYTDEFNRANENPIAGDWISGDGAGVGDLEIDANEIECVSTFTNGAAYVDPAVADFADDHFAQGVVTWAGGGGARHVGLSCRQTSNNFYAGRIDVQGGTYQIIEMVSGSPTELVNGGTLGSSGVTVKFDASGSSLEVFEDDVSQQSTTDTSLTTGQPGMSFFVSQVNNKNIDSFFADDGVSAGFLQPSLLVMRAVPHASLY